MTKHMVKYYFLIFISACFLTPLTSTAQSSKAEKAIRSVMKDQETAWNNGNLEDFMKGYWKSDSLSFIGSRGLTRGWDQTLANYKKGYATREAMGKLTFTILKVEPLSKKSAFVIGKWHLKREKDELSGHYTLLWKKINGHWVIVADHSS